MYESGGARVASLTTCTIFSTATKKLTLCCTVNKLDFEINTVKQDGVECYKTSRHSDIQMTSYLQLVVEPDVAELELCQFVVLFNRLAPANDKKYVYLGATTVTRHLQSR